MRFRDDKLRGAQRKILDDLCEISVDNHWTHGFDLGIVKMNVRNRIVKKNLFVQHVGKAELEEGVSPDVVPYVFPIKVECQYRIDILHVMPEFSDRIHVRDMRSCDRR